MNKKNYSDWGVFGTATESGTPQPDEQKQWPQKENNNVCFTCEVKPDGTQVRKTDPHDTPEEKAEIRAWAKLEALKAKLNSPEGKLYKLSGNRDTMTAIIELARCDAACYDDLHSVWAALVEMSVWPNHPPPLLGMTEDFSAVKYRGNDGKTAIFTQAQLKMRLNRQEKARKST